MASGVSLPIKDHRDFVAQRFSAAKKRLAGLKPCATSVPLRRGRTTRVRARVIAGSVVVWGVAWMSAQGTTGQSPARIRGFSAASGAEEASRERDMKAAPSAKTNETDFDTMTAEPHQVLASAVTGVTLLRLANAEMLPLDYEVYGKQILDTSSRSSRRRSRHPPRARRRSILPA